MKNREGERDDNPLLAQGDREDDPLLAQGALMCGRAPPFGRAAKQGSSLVIGRSSFVFSSVSHAPLRARL